MEVTDPPRVSFFKRARCFQCGLACFGIGLFVVWHGQFDKSGSGIIDGFTAIIGLALVHWMNKGISAQLREIVEM